MSQNKALWQYSSKDGGGRGKLVFAKTFSRHGSEKKRPYECCNVYPATGVSVCCSAALRTPTWVRPIPSVRFPVRAGRPGTAGLLLTRMHGVNSKIGIKTTNKNLDNLKLVHLNTGNSRIELDSDVVFVRTNLGVASSKYMQTHTRITKKHREHCTAITLARLPVGPSK